MANGIVVQSNDAQPLAHPPDLAVWNPQTGQVTVTGRAVGNTVAGRDQPRPGSQRHPRTVICRTDAAEFPGRAGTAAGTARSSG